jgi:hypothetical protein
MYAYMYAYKYAYMYVGKLIVNAAFLFPPDVCM